MDLKLVDGERGVIIKEYKVVLKVGRGNNKKCLHFY